MTLYANVSNGLRGCYMASVKIPFAGFYETKWSDMIDSQERYAIEHEVEERQKEEGIPEHLRLDEDEFQEIYMRVSDYSAGYAAIARGYVDAFPEAFTDATDLPLALEYEEMTSPKYYNFETDRLFAKAPLAHLYLMFRASRNEKHATLAQVIKRRFTSCSGFISHYSNDLAEWLEKPLCEWDHNELETLLLATLERAAGGDAERDIEWAIYENWPDSGYSEWSDCVDWPRLAREVQELRDEKAEQFAADNPDMPAPPYRCTETLDLFKDYRP